jgi:hypothetical protein
VPAWSLTWCAAWAAENLPSGHRYSRGASVARRALS